MEEERKEKEDEGRRIVVGITMDARSRELLTWALVKVAEPGDRVLALHILPSQPYAFAPEIDGPDPDGRPSNATLINLVKDFDSMLAAYEGFCNLKQIDLKLKLCRGSPIRKVLVREATLYAASKLIVGVSNSTCTIRNSFTSIIKYCAKKLPSSCSMLAVRNGKVIFERESLQDKYNGKSTLYCSLPPNYFSPRSPNDLKDRILSCKSEPSDNGEVKKETLALVPSRKSENSFQISGWPLLRQAFVSEKQSRSIIEWAMRLPRRYLSAIHPDKKPRKPEVAEEKLPEMLEMIAAKFSSVLRVFSYEEIKNATRNFSLENFVGEGGSSRVFKVQLPSISGKEFAAKILKPSSETAMEEFAMDIEITTKLQHKNIISLVGFGMESNSLILMYDFLPNGSLEDFLHGERKKKRILNWGERFKVAIGVAEALDYMHGSDKGEPIIHRDVKSSNILLSQDFEPQLCDFGLAMPSSLASVTAITSSRDVAGTFGYLAPEYFMHGRVTEKIDVYAFGVVLLELLSGRKPINAGSSNGQESLVLWAQKVLRGGNKVEYLVDPCLGGEYCKDQAERMILAASLCVRRSPQSRPSITRVLKLLQGEEDLEGMEGGEMATDGNAGFDIESLVDLALLDVEDLGSISDIGSETTGDIVEDYMRGRRSLSSSTS